MKNEVKDENIDYITNKNHIEFILMWGVAFFVDYMMFLFSLGHTNQKVIY